MATKSVTTEVEFTMIPASDANLFSVRPGIDAFFSISHADCIDAGVRRLLFDAVEDNGMHADIAWLANFALEAAQALRQAAGVVA